MPDVWEVTLIALLLALDLVVYFGPVSKWRTVSLSLLGILTLCSPLIAILGAMCSPAKVVTESLVVEGLEFKLVSSFDMSYETADGGNISLIVERSFLNGFLKESKTLLFVKPAFDMGNKIIERDNAISISIAAFETRPAIVRGYPLDWNTLANQNIENIAAARESL